MPETIPESAVNQRDGKGRFASGNKCGRGNPNSARVWRAVNAFHKAIPDDTLTKMVERVVDIALNSTDERCAIDAIKLILVYAIGRPRVEIEINETSTLSLDERRVLVLKMLDVDTTEFPQFKPSPALPPCQQKHLPGPTPPPSKP